MTLLVFEKSTEKYSTRAIWNIYIYCGKLQASWKSIAFTCSTAIQYYTHRYRIPIIVFSAYRVRARGDSDHRSFDWERISSVQPLRRVEGRAASISDPQILDLCACRKDKAQINNKTTQL